MCQSHKSHLTEIKLSKINKSIKCNLINAANLRDNSQETRVAMISPLKITRVVHYNVRETDRIRLIN